MMRKQRYLVGAHCRELLAESVLKRLFVKITNKDAQRWEIYKSSFLALHGNKLILAGAMPDPGQVPMEAVSGQTIAVNFKKGYNKCLFITRVIAQGTYEIEPGQSIPSLTVLCPEYIEKIPRRSFVRAQAPTDEPVAITMNSMEPRHDQFSWQATLFNLSAGGLAVVIPGNHDLDLVEGDQYSMVFVPFEGQSPLEVQGRLRHVDITDAGDTMIGFQFMGLDVNEQGINTLRRIGRVVTVYQRQTANGRYRDIRSPRS